MGTTTSYVAAALTAPHASLATLPPPLQCRFGAGLRDQEQHAFPRAFLEEAMRVGSFCQWELLLDIHV